MIGGNFSRLSVWQGILRYDSRNKLVASGKMEIIGWTSSKLNFLFCIKGHYRGSEKIIYSSFSPNVILGLYKCNYSLTVKELKLHLALKELKLHLALWRQLGGWCGPRWKWVWHHWSIEWEKLFANCISDEFYTQYI